MDHSTYVQPDVVQEAARFRMVKADMTEENDQTAALSRRYDVRGVPTVILYSSTGAEKRRFVGYVSAQEMLGAMRAVR
jgi:thiol:disulfide interchange protein DsbD